MSRKIPAPSSCLPPLKRLSGFDAAQVTTFLGHLRQIYQPEVRGVRAKAAHDSGYASEASDDDCSKSTSSTTSSIDSLRTDRFERSVAMKWLTGFITRGEEWIEEGTTGEEQTERIRVAEDAASLLAVCSGTSSNFDGALSSSTHEPPTVLPLDWRHMHCIASSSAMPTAKPEHPFDMPFDIIIGADIIYEPEHAVWIKSSVELLLKRDAQSFFYLIMPMRPTHEVETASVRETFPLAADVRKQHHAASGEQGAMKRIAIVDVSEIDRVVGTGRVDEVRYLLYRIGWV
ncbi:hypothetical protein FRC01_000367 [Tulasnella sp. 417]|nr:hypothetical protein FRC01_000367 [Tulasnella sp. 417]